MSNAIAWREIEKELFTPTEIEKNQLQAQLMCEIIEARKAEKMSQRELETLSGVAQSTIARIETGKNSPTIDTLIDLLAPLGKTLKVVPIENN